jgi:hypothetical protein
MLSKDYQIYHVQYGTCVAEHVAGFQLLFNPALVKYIFQKVKDTF